MRSSPGSADYVYSIAGRWRVVFRDEHLRDKLYRIRNFKSEQAALDALAACSAPAQAAQEQKLRDALREAERVRDEWCAEYVAIRDVQPQAAREHSDLEERLRSLAFHWRDKGFRSDAEVYELAASFIGKLRHVARDAPEGAWQSIETAPKDGSEIEIKGDSGPYGVTEWVGSAHWGTPVNWHRDVQPQAVETTDVSVPAAALDWLFGAAPDADGKWFGECEEEAADRTRRIFPPKYWWRSKFRSMIPALSRPLQD